MSEPEINADRNKPHTGSVGPGGLPDGEVEVEMKCLRDQNRMLTRELITVRDGHKNITGLLMVIQGILHRLSGNQVRQDFLAGRLGVSDCSSDMLRSLDVFSDKMLPSPYTMKGTENSGEVLAFASQLLAGDADVPVVRGAALPVNLSFAEWRATFQTIGASRYWDKKINDRDESKHQTRSVGSDHKSIDMKPRSRVMQGSDTEPEKYQ